MNIGRALPVFSIAFAVIYIASVQYNLSPLTYHAEIGQWGLGVQPPKQGPAMYWYGWLVTATVGAAAAAAVSLAIPGKALDRAWSVLVWLVPVIMIGIIMYILRGYFIR